MSTALWVLFVLALVFAGLGVFLYVKGDRPGDDFGAVGPIILCVICFVLCGLGWCGVALVHWWPF